MLSIKPNKTSLFNILTEQITLVAASLLWPRNKFGTIIAITTDSFITGTIIFEKCNRFLLVPGQTGFMLVKRKCGASRTLIYHSPKSLFYCIIFAKSETSLHLCYSLYEIHYNKICVKWPLSNRPKFGFQDQLSLNAGLKYCRMLQGKHQGEHSAILSTFINRGQKYFNIALVLQDE